MPVKYYKNWGKGQDLSLTLADRSEPTPMLGIGQERPLIFVQTVYSVRVVVCKGDSISNI